MTKKATTIRLHPLVLAQLDNLSRVLKRPMNQLVNEAVKDYVEQRSRGAEQELEATLARLRLYRQRDPDFSAADDAWVDAEARFGKDDPAEGKVVMGHLVGGKLVEGPPPHDASTLQEEIHRLLNASPLGR